MSREDEPQRIALYTLVVVAMYLLIYPRIATSVSLNAATVPANMLLSNIKRRSDAVSDSLLTKAMPNQLENLLDQSRISGSAAFILAEVYATNGDYLAAARTIEGPGNNLLPLDARLLRSGDYYWMAGKMDESIRVWERLPNALHFLLELCDGYLAIGDLELAIRYCSAATKMEPRNGWANYFLARAYRARGDIEAADVTIREAIKSEPEVTRYRFFLADLLVELGEKSAAAAEYESILERDPNNLEADKALRRLQQVK